MRAIDVFKLHNISLVCYITQHVSGLSINACAPYHRVCLFIMQHNTSQRRQNMDLSDWLWIKHSVPDRTFVDKINFSLHEGYRRWCVSTSILCDCHDQYCCNKYIRYLAVYYIETYRLKENKNYVNYQKVLGKIFVKWFEEPHNGFNCIGVLILVGRNLLECPQYALYIANHLTMLVRCK